MERRLIIPIVVLTLGLITGCSYFQTPDPRPPLPPIEETKRQLEMKSQHFKSFPWEELSAPQKDGTDPDTWTYPFKTGDTMESVAEKQMGNPDLADRLAAFNELTSPSRVAPGDKIVIPHPIIGVSAQISVKRKGSREFDPPKSFPPDFKKGDQYKLRFETNVNGYLYVFRKGMKEVVFLYPSRARTSTRTKDQRPQMRETGKVKAYDPIEIPKAEKGFDYDQRKAGESLVVFLSLKEIPDLEDLKEKPKISAPELDEVMRRVKEGSIRDFPPYYLLRISDPAHFLGITINIDG